MLSLHYHELMGKIEENEGKIYLVVDDYMLDEILDKFKQIIAIKKIDDTMIFIDTNDKFQDDISFKNVVILITCDIKDDGKFYLQIFFEEALLNL